MLTHVTLGCNDLEKARAFYDAVLEPLGMKRMMDGDVYSFWGIDRPMVIIRLPLDGKAATHANGGTVGFAAPTNAAVAAFHAAGLAHGGSSEGAPGPREAAGGMNGAYLRDPDGNKMCAFCYTAE